MAGERSISTKIIVIGTILMTIAAVITVYFQFFYQSMELSCFILSGNELTAVEKITGLQVDYRYNNKKIDHLWKVTVKFTNTGNKTIIGEGTQTSLIRGQLDFLFPTKTNILNIESLSANLPISIEKVNSNEFSLKFVQWKKAESIILNFYISSFESFSDSISLSPKIRGLLNGDIIVKDLSKNIDKGQKSFLDDFPKFIRIFITATALISIGFAAVVYVLLGILGPKDSYSYLRWKRNNFAKFKDYIEGLSNLNAEEKKNLILKPFTIPKYLLSDFKAEHPPKDLPVFTTKVALIIGSIISLIAGTCLLLYFSSLIEALQLLR